MHDADANERGWACTLGNNMVARRARTRRRLALTYLCAHASVCVFVARLYFASQMQRLRLPPQLRAMPKGALGQADPLHAEAWLEWAS